MLRHSAKNGARRLSRQLEQQVQHLQERTFLTAAGTSTSTVGRSSLNSFSQRSSCKPSTSRLAIAASPRRAFANSTRRNLATHTDDPPSTSEEDAFDLSTVERVSDQVDVCIVGGGPAGLSAAIRLMQLAKEQGNEEFRVVVLEKGGEVGGCLSISSPLHLMSHTLPLQAHISCPEQS